MAQLVYFQSAKKKYALSEDVCVRRIKPQFPILSRHVLNELIETEKTYVQQLHDILRVS